MKRKRKFRKLRRGRGKKSKMSKPEPSSDGQLTIFHSNIRGFTSKKTSLVNILKQVNPDVISLNEHGLQGKNKVIIPGYLTFTKNRLLKSMGGVSVSVGNYMRQNAVKVKEGIDDDEYVIVRVDKFRFPINVLSYYGEQESRNTNGKILEKWDRFKKDLDNIKLKGEAALIIGDFNKLVGCDEFGVEGNNPDITYGGKLVRELIKSGEYILVNNTWKTTGGPFTREDPAKLHKKSCLDFCIVSAKLFPYIKELKIDSGRELALGRVSMKNGKLTLKPPDHYPLIVLLQNLPIGNIKDQKLVQWNFRKEGGWESYKHLTDSKAEEILKTIENKEGSVEEQMKSFEKIHTKILYEAFGKTTVRITKKKPGKHELEVSEEKIAKKILESQSRRVEEEIEEIKSMKHGRATKVFKLRERIQGPKKGCQEPNAILDPESKDLVASPDEIKRVALKYCLNVLKNNDVHPEFVIETSLRDALHDVRMQETGGDANMAKENFNKIIKKFEANKKKTYDFIVKAGDNFKDAIFKLCKAMIENEKFPDSFDCTTLHQIYKGKGIKEDLSNSRFIHSKTWLPRTCEAMVVDMMKTQIITKSSKFQIGGFAKHRPQEHLFSIKSIISQKLSMGGCLILQLYDIRKFFDKENLRDAMDSLYGMGVDPKIFRAWFLLNKNMRIQVKTSVGCTEWAEAGELIGQGTVGGALVSAGNLDMSMNKAFSGSMDEVVYGSVHLNPLIFQDDIARGVQDVQSAQAGNIRISNVMKRKQLEMHPDKTGFILFGKSPSRKVIEKELKVNPIKFDGFLTHEKTQDKYLGDILHKDGLGESVAATVRERTGKTKAAAKEIVAIIEDFRMQKVGGLVAAFDLWEGAVVPSLLNNAETWVEMSEKTLKDLEELQLMFLRMILKVPQSTPKVALTAETGTLSMEWRIATRKLQFINSVKEMEDTSLAKQIFTEQVKYGWPGLAQEAIDICETLGLPNIVHQEIPQRKWKKIVKDACITHYDEEIKHKMKSLSKTEEIKDQDFQRKKYLETDTVEDARLLFRIRTKMVECKGNFQNDPGYKRDKWQCDSCNLEVETQSHVMSCPAYQDIRIGKSLDQDKDLVEYFKEVLIIRNQRDRKP